MNAKKNRKGFTLVEMLVVLGIISILTSALVVGFGRITKSAQRARAQETVSNVSTALTILLQRKGAWPAQIASKATQGADGEGKGCVEAVAKVFAKNGLLGVSYNAGRDQLQGTDRCGIVDPWATAVLKRSERNKETTKVPSGGTVRSHIIYYAVDDDLDGVTEAKVCGEDVKVRASAIAWCAGADGELGDSYSRRTKQNADNVYSWRKTQEVRK